MDARCRIRPAVRRDLPAVAALERVVFTDPWSMAGFASHLDDAFLVAEAPDGGFVGYVVTRVTVEEGEILNVAVAPGHRRAGVGRLLVEAALAAMADRGVTRVHLEVRASNRAALGLYRRTGFRVVGRRPGYYRKPPEDALLLTRNIGSA